MDHRAMMKLGDEQQAFVDAFKRSEHGTQFMVSGPGGSGKSFMLNELCDQVGQILRCAMTGTAGVLVEGVTFHNMFCVPVGLPINPSLTLKQYRFQLMKKMNGGSDPSGPVFGELMKKTSWLFPKKRLEPLAYARAIIVDEVSMALCWQVDWADKICRMARNEPQKPFGGLSIIWSGDLGQIQPITSEKDREIMASYGYRAPWGLEESMVFRNES